MAVSRALECGHRLTRLLRFLQAECRALEEAIAAAHSGVTIRGLQPVSKAQRDMLVEGEGEKDKARLIKRHATTYDLYRRRIIRA